MASRTSCLRLLRRPPASSRTSLPKVWSQAALLSTTAPAAAATPAKGGTGGKDSRQKRGGKINLDRFKKEQKRPTKQPLPGERKAYRKRIVLTNDNALTVEGAMDLTSASIVDQGSVGTMLRLPDKLVDQLRAAEAFKTTQCWNLFRWPHVLLRQSGLDVAKRMQQDLQTKQTTRLVLMGDKLVGKSMLLLQIIANAYCNDWIVVNIPEAQDLINAGTDYHPIPGSEPMQFGQTAYALKLIQAIRTANSEALETLSVIHAHKDLPGHLPIGSSLLQLANLARENENGWPVFQALWKELTTAGYHRRPILLAMDGLSHIMSVSSYRSPSYELIHAHDLALVRMFCDYLSGAKTLANGGAVIAATSRNNAPRSPSMELALLQREAEQAGKEVPARDPYGKGYDARADEILSSVPVMRVGALDKEEARALMEYWAASGVLRATVSEASVSHSWTIGGNGVIGEMERASLLQMRI